MNRNTHKKMCLASALLGLLGFVLRFSLYRVGFDEKGLLISWHPLTIGLTSVSAVMLLTALVLSLSERKQLCEGPSGLLTAAGDLCLAAGLIHTALTTQGLSMPGLILAVAAAGCLCAAAGYHFRGRQPFFLTYGMLCLFLSFYLVNRYQIWSQDPQLLDYMLALLAGAAMLLYAYQMTAGCLRQCSRRSWLLLGGLGAFAGLAGAAGGEMKGLCLGGALWILASLWSGTAGGDAYENAAS